MWTPELIAASDYEGWVAWIDGSPIFEAVPWNPKLLQLAPGMTEQAVRFDDRQTMDWKNVPGEKVERFELYFCRQHWQGQPVLQMDRQPGHHAVRFVQLKLGGIAVGANLEQSRLGLIGYRVGYWDPIRNVCEMYEYLRNGQMTKLPIVGDPCAPRPHGHGYAPVVMGRET